MARIEISFPLSVQATGSFWVGKVEWDRLSPYQRQQRIDAHINQLQRDADRGTLICDGAFGVNFGPSPSAEDVLVYDPEAENANG